MVKRLLCLTIKAYQLFISPMLGPRCRFYPSCSEYGTQAITQHGACKGSLLTLKRISRCHPLNEGGYDPVPGCTSQPHSSHRAQG